MRLFESKLIYRGAYMMNWCCALQSVISDLEVETVDLEGPTNLTVPGHDKPIPFGYLYDIKYQFVDSGEEKLPFSPIVYVLPLGFDQRLFSLTGEYCIFRGIGHGLHHSPGDCAR